MPEIRFSKRDAEILQQVRKVKDLGDTGARLLMAAPVLDMLLAMGDPKEFAVNVANSDLDSIVKGVRSIQQVAACSAQSIVLNHLEVGPDSPPHGPARDYFEHLNTQLIPKCRGA